MPLESESLAAKLSEMEWEIKHGVAINTVSVLELIATLRQYMAHAEYTNRMMESIEAKLKECKL